VIAITESSIHRAQRQNGSKIRHQGERRLRSPNKKAIAVNIAIDIRVMAITSLDGPRCEPFLSYIRPIG